MLVSPHTPICFLSLFSFSQAQESLAFSSVFHINIFCFSRIWWMMFKSTGDKETYDTTLRKGAIVFVSSSLSISTSRRNPVHTCIYPKTHKQNSQKKGSKNDTGVWWKGYFTVSNMHCVWRKVSVLLYIPLRCGSIMLQMRKLFTTFFFSIVIVIVYENSRYLSICFTKSQWVTTSRHRVFTFHKRQKLSFSGAQGASLFLICFIISTEREVPDFSTQCILSYPVLSKPKHCPIALTPRPSELSQSASIFPQQQWLQSYW